MMPSNEPSPAVHVPPAFAAAHQRTRLQANAVLLRYGHIIPVVAVLVCLIVSGAISIQREVSYANAAAKNSTTTTPAPATTTTVTPALSTTSTTTTTAAVSSAAPALSTSSTAAPAAAESGEHDDGDDGDDAIEGEGN